MLAARVPRAFERAVRCAGGRWAPAQSGSFSYCTSAIRSRSTACAVLALRSLHSQAVRVRLQRAIEELLRGRLSCSLRRERPGAQNSRGRTAQPLLRGEAGPDNDARPVLLGRVGRRGAPLHGYCSSLRYAAAVYFPSRRRRWEGESLVHRKDVRVFFV